MSPMVHVARARHDQVLERSMDVRHWQTRALDRLIRRARDTAFGRDHGFSGIRTYEDFRRSVPIRSCTEYQAGYWKRIYEGERDVCWPGKVDLLLSTGGTTAGRKLVPASAEQIAHSRLCSLDSVLFFTAWKGTPDLLAGRQLTVGGSWKGARHESGARIFKISGAGTGTAPTLLRRMFLSPSYETNVIEDFDRKLDAIAAECSLEDVTMIASTPVWLIALLERVGRLRGIGDGNDDILSVWPNLQACMYSGAGIGPYDRIFRRWLGPDVPLWELYAASEGFFAAMDDPCEDGMLVIPDRKLLLEFVPLEEFGSPGAQRLPLWEVEAGKEYAVVVSNCAGLFAYSMGDTVRFTSTSPYRLAVTGRVGFYLNVAGEHLTGEVVDRSVRRAQDSTGVGMREYTVGPRPADAGPLPGHEWIVEFGHGEERAGEFMAALDESLISMNACYAGCRAGGAMARPGVRPVPRGTFRRWISTHKHDDPQAKVPKLKNDRMVVDQVLGLAT